MTRAPLSKRQKEVLDFIEQYRAGHGISPTLAEIGAACGFNISTAHKHVSALQGKCYLSAIRGASRSATPIPEIDRVAELEAEVAKFHALKEEIRLEIEEQRELARDHLNNNDYEWHTACQWAADALEDLLRITVAEP